jgi:type I restriction enzyme M protein
MAKTNTAELGFEKQIWKAADLLRGNMDASEYKSVVLGLIFLKYISDSFEAKHQALINEGEGFEEDKDEYSYEHIFFVPKEARWSVIAEAAHTPEIGTVIDNAMRLIEKENELDGTYKVLSAFHYMEDLVDCITISEEVQDEIPE